MQELKSISVIGKVKRIVYTIIILAFISCISVILYNLWHHKDTPPPQPTTTKKASVIVDNKVKDNTVVYYTKKEDGETTDVEINRTQKPIVVKVNGKETKIPTTNVKETQKLENGKLVVSEEREIKFDIIAPPPPPTLKKGLYLEHDVFHKTNTVGIRASYQTQKYDVDATLDLWTQNKDSDKRFLIKGTYWF